MEKTPIRIAIAALLVVCALAVGLVGCSGGGEQTAAPPTTVAGAGAVPITATTQTPPPAIDALSTFNSKDPFVPQEVASTGSTGSTSGSTTTTTGSNSGTTTTTHANQVDDSMHSLKVLSIDEVNGEPVVTFEVDGVVYQDKQEGEVVSTSWGQIKVVSIDAENQEVVFLHGSEERTLGVGQEYLK